MRPSVNVSALYSSNAAFALAGAFIVVCGPANDGPVNVPTPITQPSQAIDVFKGGPLAQWTAKIIASKRIPVLAVRAEATAVSAFGAVTRTTGHGTSEITVDAGSSTDVNAVVEVLFHTGGTVGTPGITYQVSTDGGATFAALAPLGTATSIAVTLGSDTLTLNLGTGTLVAGELVTVEASVIAAGTTSTLDTSAYPGGTNTATPSLDATTYPDDDYEVIVEFPTGGALGTPGITYRVSISGALVEGDWSEVTALGTALSLTLASIGGQRLVLGTAGQTIGAGSSLSFRTYAPNFNTGSISAALNALFRNKSDWELVALCGAVDASMALTIDSIFAANYTATTNGEKAWIGNVRMPQRNETDAAYFTAMQLIANAGRSCYFGGLCYGDCKLTSAITGYLHKRPVALPVAMELASVTPNIDIARVDRPALGVLLADSAGNPDCHDEDVLPGPDDYGFITLRTQPEGVYVTNPRIFSPKGSMLEYFPHRQCLNLHTRTARNYFRKALSVDLYANKDGTLFEGDAKRLESEANKAENDTLRKPGWISSQLITVSRTDQLLGVSPANITVSGKLQPKIYPKQISYTEQLVASIAS